MSFNLVNVSKNPYWEQWRENCKERQDHYASYVNTHDDEDVKLFGGSANIIGDDEFKAAIRTRNGRPSTNKVGRPRKQSQKSHASFFNGINYKK